MDYGAIAPEINSGRLWTGVGSAPTVAAAAAWQAVASELAAAAAAYSSAVAALGTSWLGPSSAAMEAANMPKIAWLIDSAIQSEQMAASHFQLATAFETAFAGVAPPALIAENRTRLATLIATNFLGVNSPAIAATEAQYAEMWAQDSATLYAYAADASAVADSIVPFTPPTMTTDPAGLAAQAAAVGEATTESTATNAAQSASGAGSAASMPSSMASMVSAAPQAISAIPQALQSMAGMGAPLASGLGQFSSFLSPMMGPSAFSTFAAAPGMSSGTPSVSASMGGARGISASMMSEGGGPVSTRLSVPASWAAAGGQTITKEEQMATALSEEEGVTPMGAVPRAGMMPAMAGANSSSPGASAPVLTKKQSPRLKVVLKDL